MDSLANYGSDEDSHDSTDQRSPEMPGKSANNSSGTSRSSQKASVHEDNYEEVGMDMSECPLSASLAAGGLSATVSSQESNDSDSHKERAPSKPEKSSKHERRSRSNSPKYKRDDRRDRRRDDRDSRGRRDDRRDRRDDRSHRRDRRKSRSRDRRRSRSPRKSRSGSRERSRPFPTRKEKADKRMDRLGKLGIEFKPDTYPLGVIDEAERSSKGKDERFFVPGITGRFRDQIEKRKLLWQKAKEPETSVAPTVSVAPSTSLVAGGSKATKVYEATTFADDRTSNKFKRLMGIKSSDESVKNLPIKGTDVLKKQQEMFTSMEAQYEVARAATHTMRGVGLGFGSFQR